MQFLSNLSQHRLRTDKNFLQSSNLLQIILHIAFRLDITIELFDLFETFLNSIDIGLSDILSMGVRDGFAR